MASNKELIANILAISPSAVTEGLTNAQLSEMVKGLKGSDAAAAQADEDAAAQALADAAAAQADEDAAAQALADAEKPYTVAKGKAITSKRGILSDGDEVRASDFAGGGEAFAALCKKGHIVR